MDIDAGKFAVGNTKNAEVKKFAELMISDHSAVNEQATTTVRASKLELTSVENSAI